VGDYPFYESSVTLRCTPKQSYINDFNAIHDFTFENAPNIMTDIDEETSIGSKTYEDIVARVTSVVDPSTQQNLGDDWKIFSFYTDEDKRPLGTSFKWRDNYWLATNTNSYETLSNYCIVRRSNNIMQHRNENAVLIQEPCVIDIGITRDAFNIGQIIVLPDGVIQVTAQNNANTRLWDIDDRFIFGGQAWKIQSFDNLRNQTTFGNDDNPLIIWRMCKDAERATDDLVNNIADNSDLVYVLTINQGNFNNIVGFTSTLSTTVKCNGEIVSEGVTWSSSDATKVSVSSAGLITCLALGSAVITAKMTDNISVSDTVTITVVESVTPVSEIRISPTETIILRGDTQIYTVYKFLNGVQQADTFTITTSGAAASKYDCQIISGNSFSVRNIEQSDTALTVLCADDIDASTQTIEIVLGGWY
jgi:hypothetical protein